MLNVAYENLAFLIWSSLPDWVVSANSTPLTCLRLARINFGTLEIFYIAQLQGIGCRSKRKLLVKRFIAKQLDDVIIE